MEKLFHIVPNVLNIEFGVQLSEIDMWEMLKDKTACSLIGTFDDVHEPDNIMMI